MIKSLTKNCRFIIRNRNIVADNIDLLIECFTREGDNYENNKIK